MLDKNGLQVLPNLNEFNLLQAFAESEELDAVVSEEQLVDAAERQLKALFGQLEANS